MGYGIGSLIVFAAVMDPDVLGRGGREVGLLKGHLCREPVPGSNRGATLL